MDSDPCAASRVQIDTKTTSDLTAFELAGGNLGEHIAMVSTVSGNPREHAPTVVKNEAIQQMLDEITLRVRCDICDVVCYGKETIKRHNEGTKHLENVQKLSVPMKEKISAPVNSLFVYDTPDLPSFHNQNLVTEDKKTGGNLGEPTTKVSTTPRSLAHAQPIVKDVIKTQTQTEIFHCDSCDVFCYDVEALKRHKRNKHLQSSQTLPVAINQKTPPLFANDVAVNSLFAGDILDLETFQNENILIKHPEGKQASGTLDKPTTILSMASSTSANSRIDAPQTVKDVTVTNKKSENGNFIVCDVCNVTSNSQTDFNIHKKGKKHLKITQKFLSLTSAIKQDVPSSVAKEAKQDLSQKGTVNPLPVCDIPDPTTDLYQNKVTEMTLFDDTLKAHEELNVRQPPFCEVCKVTYCCHKCLDTHILGEQHLKNLKNSEPNVSSPSSIPIVSMDIMPIESNKIPKFPLNDITSVTTLPNDAASKAVNLKESYNVRCELCDITCVSPAQLKEHISGIKHKKNSRKSMILTEQESHPAAKQSLPNPMIKEGKVVFETSSSSESDNEDLNTKRQKVVEEDEGSGVRVTCKLCQVACNSVMEFNSHLARVEHSAVVSKQVNWG